MSIIERLTRPFFRPVSAWGFGLMRIAWAAVTFAYMLGEWGDIARYYSEEGLLPRAIQPFVLRQEYHLTLFDWVTSPAAVFAAYLLLLCSLLLMMIGWRPRLTTIVSVLLVFSFHERNFLVLAGGETVTRLLGFLLMIAPGTAAFSLARLGAQRESFRRDRALLLPLTMQAWPYLLLLWQFVVIYASSAWEKATGAMWLNGTAVAAVLHHLTFVRSPASSLVGVLSAATAPLTLGALGWEFAWLLMLAPPAAKRAVLRRFAPWLKRALILGGLLFHGGIFVLLDAGSFSLIVAAGYLGLLLDEDWQAIRRTLNRRVRRGKIAVLYDGTCGLCIRSAFWIAILDHLHRAELVDFRDASLRKKFAPMLRPANLDRALHVVFPGGRVERGFDAFRALSWNLPALWPVAPLLYVPGIPTIGRRVYAKVAERRERCTHGECKQ